MSRGDSDEGERGPSTPKRSEAEAWRREHKEMTCERYREAIQEMVDGTLGRIRLAELELHLQQCDACRALAADVQRIHDLAASLDTLAPPDGVWLQVAGRLRQEGRVAPPAPVPATSRRHYAILALAAALLIAVGASIAILFPEFRANNSGGAARTSTPAQPGNAASEDPVQAVENEFRLAEQHYQNAIAKLEEAARIGKPAGDDQALDPQTAAMLQKSLSVIDQAIAESRAALRSEPASAAARDSLFDALRRKVVLLQDTIALMNEMRKGNSAGAAQLVDGVNKS